MANSDSSEQFCGYSNVDEYSQASLKAVMTAVRASNDLPVTGEDFDYCSSFSSFQQYLGLQKTRVLQIMQSVMRYHGVRGSFAANSELTDVEDRFDVLVDANDQLFERVGTLLDEAAGLRKKETSLVVVTQTPKQSTPASGSWNKKVTPQSASSVGKHSFRLLTARNVCRPQVNFKDKIDNSERPFVPKIISKPNAQKSLEESLKCQAPDGDVDSSFCYPHPYQFELEAFEPKPSCLEKSQPQPALPIDSTPLTMVTTEEELKNLCQILKRQKEFAVDLEHHSYRSYQGFTCLIQISTRDHDYIIDALLLREHLHMLNDSFTDPNILKVFHGADHDVLWLQRDFGVYVVGLFDTYQASRSMAFVRHRLQDLLWHYCSVETNKEYQLEDWRIRPLPEEFILYARMDTHYLLYIYDCIRNDLLHRSNEQKNILLSVFQRSTQVCLKRYAKPLLKSDSYKDLLISHRKVFNAQQLAALKSLVNWRDRVARESDESVGFVLPNLMMLQIAELLPRDPEGILACCSNIPPLVRENLMELHQIIKEARVVSTVSEGSSQSPKKSVTFTSPQRAVVNRQKFIYCPHDTSHSDESSVKIDVDACLFDVPIKQQPTLTALAAQPQAAEKTEGQKRAEKIRQSFVDPFSKYMPRADASTTTSQTADLTKDSAVWKLMPNTVKKSSVSQPQVVEVVQTEATILFEANREKSKADNKEEKIDQDTTTIRQQLSSERKRKSSTSDGIVEESEKRKLKKKKRDREKELSNETKTDDKGQKEVEFVARDYTKVNFSELLEDNDSKKSNVGRKKKREYDSLSAVADSGIKTASAKKRPLLGTTPSNKAMTYVQNTNSGSNSVPRISWPKR